MKTALMKHNKGLLFDSQIGHLLIIAGLLFFAARFSFAAEHTPEVVVEKAPIMDVGLTADGDTLVAQTFYRNSCVQAFDTASQLDGQALVLVHLTQVEKSEACLRVVDYPVVEFSLADLKPGTYQLVDGNDGAYLGEISINGELTKINK